MDKKPCPFCGGTDLATPPGVAIVVCGDCGACGPTRLPHPRSDSLTILNAFTGWNERVNATEKEKSDG